MHDTLMAQIRFPYATLTTCGKLVTCHIAGIGKPGLYDALLAYYASLGQIVCIKRMDQKSGKGWMT